MGRLFEEIDSQDSPIGEISLRRRRIPGLTEDDIYEVKLGDEFLMSSLFVEAEEALAHLGLARLDRPAIDVVVGGLGLGYTAVAALQDARVREQWVVDFLPPVIRWHQEEKVPLGAILNRDARNHYVLGSFFDLAVQPAVGFVPDQPGRQIDAILLDIDHSPSAVLDADNAHFYAPDKLRQMAELLTNGGVFALWSNERADDRFMRTLGEVFREVQAEEVRFFNPLQNAEAINTVYTALKA